MAEILLFNNVTPSTSFADNISATVPVRDLENGPISLYVAYTKGDETSVEFQVEVAFKDTPASTEWYLPVVSTGVANSQVLTITATSKVRVAINQASQAASLQPIGALSRGERAVRFSVKRTGGIAPGTVTAYAVHS